MTKLDTMYRVMILYMLNIVEYPLTNTQITNFVLEKEYTSYFNVQEAITGLLKTDLITAESTHNNTRYHLTEYGEQTLAFFHAKISDAIKEDIRTYFQAHHFDLKQETAVFADFYKASGQGYAVRCRIQNQSTDIVDLTLHVQNRAQAEAVCRNWKESNVDIYETLMDTLIK